MSSSTYHSIYSPETTGIAAGEEALVLARREHEQMVVAVRQQLNMELQKLSQEKERLEAQKAVVRQNEAKNWLETSRIKTDRSQLENETAIVKRDHQLLEKRELQIRQQEDQRRRNRFVL